MEESAPKAAVNTSSGSNMQEKESAKSVDSSSKSVMVTQSTQSDKSVSSANSTSANHKVSKSESSNTTEVSPDPVSRNSSASTTQHMDLSLTPKKPAADLAAETDRLKFKESKNEVSSARANNAALNENEDDDKNASRAKVRWNVEPRLTVMRKAVETVLNGANTTEVAGRFGIPARTLRRYVANEKRRRESGNTTGGILPKKKKKKSKAAAKKAQRMKERQQRRERKAKERAAMLDGRSGAAKSPFMSLEVNLRDPMQISDSPLAGPIQSLGLQPNEMGGLGDGTHMGNKRTRTGSLELFLEALAPVAVRQRQRESRDDMSGKFARNDVKGTKGRTKGKPSLLIAAAGGESTLVPSSLRRDRLDSLGFLGGRQRKNSLDLFNWALEQRTSAGLGPTGPKAVTLEKDAEALAAALATEAVLVSSSSVGFHETSRSGFTSPRFRSPSIDYLAGDHDCVLMSPTDSTLGLNVPGKKAALN